MREIGVITHEQQAHTFSDYLLTLHIKSKLEYQTTGWAVWIYDEEQLAAAREQLARFLENPTAPAYSEAASGAKAARREAARLEAVYRKNVIDARTIWSPSLSRVRLTILLMAASVAVALATNFGRSRDDWIGRLAVASTTRDRSASEGLWSYRLGGLAEVREGQVWRLITPIFLHFGGRHLLFNLWSLFTLGSLLEARRGSLRFLGLVLAMSVLSNLGQYWYSGPLFGGMSGVVYGLFGYAWIKSHYAPQLGIFVSQGTIFLMILWFALCLTGEWGPVANVAHGVGLVTGMAIAAIPVIRARWRSP